MKEIIDEYAPILEGEVTTGDVKKKQKQLRLSNKKEDKNKSDTSLKPLKRVKPDQGATS